MMPTGDISIPSSPQTTATVLLFLSPPSLRRPCVTHRQMGKAGKKTQKPFYFPEEEEEEGGDRRGGGEEEEEDRYVV